MTNRKKYIDNQNNKQLASLLANENVIEDEDGKGKFLITLIKGNFISRAKEIEEWLSQEAELTADEMFEELGYKLESKQASYDVYKNVKYKDKYDIRIKIGYDGNYSKQYDYNTPEYLKFIVKAEDKAIHKKIEELKNGQ